MPLSLRILRSKSPKNDSTKDVFRTTKKKGFFRRVKLSKSKKANSDAPLLRPLEQAITWTMSDDSASPIATEGQVSVSAERVAESSVPKIYTFTEDELMQNELNQIRSLSALKEDVRKLKAVSDELASLHKKQLAKKDDDYVELMIALEEKRLELAQTRAELAGAKEELGTISVALLRAQHELFETKHNSWRSIFF